MFQRSSYNNSNSNSNNKIEDVRISTAHQTSNTTSATSVTGMITDTTTNTTSISCSSGSPNECKLLAISNTATGSTTSLPYPSYTLTDRRYVPILQNDNDTDNDNYFDFSYTDTVITPLDHFNNKQHGWIFKCFYNNKVLLQKLIGDIIVGATVSLAIAPVLSVIDKAVVERVSMDNNTTSTGNTAKNGGIVQSVQNSIVSIVRNPFQYVRSPAFTWMWLTYSVTYISANSLRTITSHNYNMNNDSSTTITSTTNTTNTSNNNNNNNFSKSSSASIVFIGTTVVNSISSMMKDRAYAQMFSTSNTSTLKKTTVPLLSYGLWIGRDITVIGSSFIIPNYICPTIQNISGLSYTNSLQVSQIVSPILAQFVATSFHCIGLDYVNRPTIVLPTVSSSTTMASPSSLLLPNNNNSNSRSTTSIYNLSTGIHRNTHTHAIGGSSSNSSQLNTMLFTLQNRYTMLHSCFVEVVTARIARVIPAYGIGGVYNTHYRNQWHTMVTNKNN